MANPDSNQPLYDQIVTTIGEVCLIWANIDDIIMGISLHSAWCIDFAFQMAKPWEILAIAMVNSDERAKIVTAKALAHLAEKEHSPDLYARTEELMNFVGGQTSP